MLSLPAASCLLGHQEQLLKRSKAKPSATRIKHFLFGWPRLPRQEGDFLPRYKKTQGRKGPGTSFFCPPKHLFNLYSLKCGYIVGVIGKGLLGKWRISRGGREVGEGNGAK